MTMPPLPSSPAADLHGPRTLALADARHVLRQRLIGVAAAAGLVLVLGSIATAVLAAVGTGSCERDADGDEICVKRSWWPFTIQQRAEVWTLNGEAHGPRVEWHRNGQVWFSGEYDHGRRTGRWREFWPDGTPRFAGTYKDDRLDGTEYWYQPDGAVEWVVERRAGERVGMERWYWPNGVLRREGPFVDGEKDGVFHSWDDAGRPTMTTTYRRGVRVDPG
jgi:hypothetical protein